jgi:thiol-disulfide isomerase/thioredoxin
MRRWCLLALLIVLWPVMVLHGADPAVKLGTEISWTDLPGVDDRKHSLADLKDKEVVVVAITCNHCPVAREYFARMKDFVRTNAGEGSKVVLVAIALGDMEADMLPSMKQLAARLEFNFPYLYDESQGIGRRLGATVTPHFFVLDAQRRLVYRGAWDDNVNPAQVKKSYVEDAVKALLTGKKPPAEQTEPRGCSIPYRR